MHHHSPLNPNDPDPAALWGEGKPFFSYRALMNALFGGRVQKVAIDAGFTCPNRNANREGGCTYCNNLAFNPNYCDPARSVSQQLVDGIGFHSHRYQRAGGYIAYFQAYTNTFAPVERLERLFGEALEVEGVVGLSIATRPDTLPPRVLQLLGQLGRRCPVFVEIGAESMHDATLRRVNRGHTAEATERAIVALAEEGLHVGVHMILGLPGESDAMMFESLERIVALPISSIKMHQLQILRDTVMVREFERGEVRIRFPSLWTYLPFAAEYIRRLPPRVAVERVAAEAPPRHVVAPSWGLVRYDQMLVALERYMVRQGMRQGDRWVG